MTLLSSTYLIFKAQGIRASSFIHLTISLVLSFFSMEQALKHPTALACTSTNARTSWRFVRAFGRGGFFLLLVVTVVLAWMLDGALAWSAYSGVQKRSAKSIDEG